MSQEFWRKRKKPKDGAPDHKKKRQMAPQSASVASLWSDRLTSEYLLSSSRPRSYTISVAIPGSIIKNAQTQELRTHLVGQIARTIALYEIDEIVVFMDTGAEQAGDPDRGPSAFFSRLLQYIEAPPYLRKKLFPMHNDLKFTGLLPPLESPHHMRRDDKSRYREGIVTDRPASEGTSNVDIGLPIDVTIPHQLRAGVRVTVSLKYDPSPPMDRGVPLPQTAATAVSPNDPREKFGLYWGYRTRLARSLGEVFSGCPFGQAVAGGGGSGYDFMVGHSSTRPTAAAAEATNKSPEKDPSFASSVSGCRHILLVFGGVSGLEACVEADEGITTNARDTDTLFDLYWNCSANNFGSRTLRTEEEVLISLTRLVPLIREAHGDVPTI
jgi:methyltransferase